MPQIETHRSEASLIRMDNSQVLGSFAAAEYLNGLPENERNSPEALKSAKEISKNRIKQVREQMNPVAMPASPEMDESGTPIAPQSKPISPEDIIRRRYILAVTRLATGKVDDPEYSDMELMDIAMVAGAGNIPMISIKNFEECIRNIGK